MNNNSLMPFGNNDNESLIATLIMICLSPYFKKKAMEEQARLIRENMQMIARARTEIMDTISNMSKNRTLTPEYFSRLMSAYESLSFRLC